MSSRKRWSWSGTGRFQPMDMGFVYGGGEALTEPVIQELVRRGWPEADVRWAARQGFLYSRARDSLVLPSGMDIYPRLCRRRVAKKS